MNRVRRPNFIFLTISNVLFCCVLVALSGHLIYKYKIDSSSLISFLILLLTGIYSGFTTSRSSSKTRLYYSVISSTIFFAIYLIAGFVFNSAILLNGSHLICAINIYFGTLIGCIISINKKHRNRKGRR